MAFPLRLVWLYLWIVPHVLLIPIAVVMGRKGLHKDFPVFFTYLIYEILQFSILFSMYQLKAHGESLLNVDRIVRGGSVALRFGIIQEMFESPFVNIIPMRRAMGRTFNLLVVVLVVLAITFIAPMFYRIPGVLKGYAGIEALNAVQCGLLACVFIWHSVLGLRMSACVFGITLGMGLVPSFEPLMYALKSLVSPQNSKFVDLAQMGIFHVAVVVWLYYVRSREAAAANICAAYLLEARDWAAGTERITRL